MDLACPNFSDGLQCRSISSDKLTLGIIPQLGGKILTLIDRTNETDWMWSPPDGRGLFPNALHDSFLHSTLSGADECFPTIGPCRWNERDLPDHGELWAIPWEVLSHTECEIDLSVRAPLSPFIFSRRITVAGHSARFSYALKNIGGTAEKFLWAFHPMLKCDKGDYLEIPAKSARIDSEVNTPFGSRGSAIALPEPLPGMHLGRMDFGARGPAAVKYFTDSLDEGRVALVRPKLKRRLAFEFDRKEINTVGVWINTGGWAGYRHVIIEPTNGAPDPLDVAAKWNRCGDIGAGATLTWSMTLRLETISDPGTGSVFSGGFWG